MKIKEYGSGREGDVANGSRHREKDDRKGKGVRPWAGHECSGDMAKGRKSRNSCSKAAIFLPCHKTIDAAGVAALYLT